MRLKPLFACLALILCLAGCKSPPPPASPLAGHSGNFDTTANITYGDLKASARLIRETPQSCEVSFTAPDSLKDLSFVFRSGSVDLNYKKLSFTFDPDSLPGGAVAGIAVDAINAAMRGKGLEIAREGDSLTLSGTLASGSFTMRLGASEGNLLHLSIPDQELEIEFLNFTFLE